VRSATDSGNLQGDRSFELNPDPDYRRVRVLRFLFIGFASVMVLGIAFLASRALEHSLAGGVDALILGGTILSGGVGAGIWAALGLGRGADSCQLTADGFVLGYRNGRVTRFSWSDPALRFKTYELLSRGQLEYTIATRRPSLNPIPPELYQALLSEARVRGLEVTEQIATLATGHQTTTSIRAKNRSARS
jgi:hypothetical protein